MFISKSDVLKAFSDLELQKMKQLKMVLFPDEEEIKARILIIEKVMTMKKTAFLNGTNTNFLPASMRDFYLDPVTKKLYKWVQGIQERTRVKINTAVQQKTGNNKSHKQGTVYHDEKEKLLMSPADGQTFKVVSMKKEVYRRPMDYKKKVYTRHKIEDKIAEGVIERLINEISFK